MGSFGLCLVHYYSLILAMEQSDWLILVVGPLKLLSHVINSYYILVYSSCLTRQWSLYLTKSLSHCLPHRRQLPEFWRVARVMKHTKII